MVILKNNRGASLIELIMTILVVAIIGATIIGVIVFMVQIYMYTPNQLDTQKIGEELSRTMLEGDQNVRGIRYTRSVLDASATQFSYTYGYITVPATPTKDTLAVRFSWNSGDKHIYRSTSTDAGATWSSAVVPYYILPGLTIDGKDVAGVIFTYKKAGDVDWVSGTDPLSAIRRVTISINLKTGSGSFDNFEGNTNITFSAEIKGF